MFLFINSFKRVLFKLIWVLVLTEGTCFFYIKLYNSLVYNSNKTVVLKYMHNNILFDTVPDPILNCS